MKFNNKNNKNGAHELMDNLDNIAKYMKKNVDITKANVGVIPLGVELELDQNDAEQNKLMVVLSSYVGSALNMDKPDSTDFCLRSVFYNPTVGYWVLSNHSHRMNDSLSVDSYAVVPTEIVNDLLNKYDELYGSSEMVN